MPSPPPRSALAWPPLPCKRALCPQNLAGGLGALVESNLAVKAAAQQCALQWLRHPTGGRLTPISRFRILRPAASSSTFIRLDSRRQRREAGRLCCRNVFRPSRSPRMDKKYRGVGVVEGFIALDDVPALGNMHEVRSVTLGSQARDESSRPTRWRDSARHHLARARHCDRPRRLSASRRSDQQILQSMRATSTSKALG